MSNQWCSWGYLTWGRQGEVNTQDDLINVPFIFFFFWLVIGKAGTESSLLWGKHVLFPSLGSSLKSINISSSKVVPLSWDLFRIVGYIVIGKHSGMLSKYLSRGTVICKRWCFCLDKSVVSAWWTCYIIRIFLGSFKNLWKQWAFLFEIAYY